MDTQTIIEFAPLILVVLYFFWQNNVFVKPEQLERKHREILEDVDRHYTTKEATDNLEQQLNDIQTKIDRMYDRIINNK